MKKQPKKQPGKVSRRELRAMMRRSDRMQARNWKKHFAEHPEQLQPGAEVKRTVPLKEMELLADIIGQAMFSPYQ